jgi:hypothetical protein
MHEVDVVVVTRGDAHLLDQVPGTLFRHLRADGDPAALGLECHAALRDALGGYDYYCYLEDDLVLHDPWFFVKLAWFEARFGPEAVLQPNRYETALAGPSLKAYIDGDLAPHVVSRFKLGGEAVEGDALGARVRFERALNPHAGSFFLSARQMEHWAAQPHFLDADTSFVGPLESAATLGLIKTFAVYKPARPNAAFLEIQHVGGGFIGLIGTDVRPASA